MRENGRPDKSQLELPLPGSKTNGSLMSKIGPAVKIYRRDKLHLSERHFAQKAHISRNSLRIIENGKASDYSIGLIDRILGALNLDLFALLEKSGTNGHGHFAQGTLKGEFQMRYPDAGFHITSLTGRNSAFFFGLLEVEAKRSITADRLPHASFLLFQGFRGKMLLRYSEREYLLDEDRHFFFTDSVVPEEIYNSDQLRPASCYILTLPSFLAV